MDGSLFERGKALEDQFFQEKDKQLLEKLKRELAENEQRTALAQASGIDDDAVLDAMLASEVTAETLTGMSMVPLVVIAWADGRMESSEVAAILKAAEESGVREGTASHDLLQSWLKTKPDAALFDAWKNYVATLKSTLDEALFQQLKTSVVGRAKMVAESAGGILGLGSVSEAERKKLDELQAAFD